MLHQPATTGVVQATLQYDEERQVFSFLALSLTSYVTLRSIL